MHRFKVLEERDDDLPKRECRGLSTECEVAIPLHLEAPYVTLFAAVTAALAGKLHDEVASTCTLSMETLLITNTN